MDQAKTENGYTICITNQEVEIVRKIVFQTALSIVINRIVKFVVWR